MFKSDENFNHFARVQCSILMLNQICAAPFGAKFDKWWNDTVLTVGHSSLLSTTTSVDRAIVPLQWPRSIFNCSRCEINGIGQMLRNRIACDCTRNDVLAIFPPETIHTRTIWPRVRANVMPSANISVCTLEALDWTQWTWCVSACKWYVRLRCGDAHRPDSVINLVRFISIYQFK